MKIADSTDPDFISIDPIEPHTTQAQLNLVKFKWNQNRVTWLSIAKLKFIGPQYKILSFP